MRLARRARVACPGAVYEDAEPALMRHKAREVLVALGHNEPPADSAERYIVNFYYYEWVRADDNPMPEKWDGHGVDWKTDVRRP